MFILKHIQWTACLIVLIVSSVVASAQSQSDSALDKLLTEYRPVDCNVYVLNAYKIIPRMHQESKFDSIEVIISFISRHCEKSRLETYQLLRKIEKGELDSLWCDTSIIREMFDATLQPEYYYHRTHFNWGIPKASTGESFESFLKTMATQMLSALDSASAAHALALYYSGKGEMLLKRLANNSYKATCLQQAYNAKVDSLKKIRRDWSANWSVSTGIWVPHGKLKFLGPKPELGVQLGLRGRHLGGDISFFVRFLNAPEKYQVKYKDSVYRTNKFQSLYFGIEPTLIIYSSMRSSLELFGGIGYDGLLALNSKEIDSKDAFFLNSANLNAGLTWRLFYDSRCLSAIGLQFRVSSLRYMNSGGTELTGGAISLNFIAGAVGHGWVDEEYFRLVQGKFFRPQIY